MSKVHSCQETFLDFVKMRNIKGYSQRELSRQSGIDVKTLRSWERGTSLPTDGNINIIADKLGVDRDVLATTLKARYYARQLKLLGCSVDDLKFLYEQVA